MFLVPLKIVLLILSIIGSQTDKPFITKTTEHLTPLSSNPDKNEISHDTDEEVEKILQDENETNVDEEPDIQGEVEKVLQDVEYLVTTTTS